MNEPSKAPLETDVARWRNPIAEFVATWFGLGFAPLAPGTLGALAAVPLFYVTSSSPLALWGMIAVLITAGAWAAGETATRLGEHDPQIVVVDEVVGALISFALCSGSFASASAAFILFRALDIAKPWPLSALERCRPPAFAIMADDILAGVLAGLAARFI